jgi:PAS domain-containing protein
MNMTQRFQETSAVSSNISLGDIRVPDLFRDLPDAVIITDPDRRITWVNPAFQTLLATARTS